MDAKKNYESDSVYSRHWAISELNSRDPDRIGRSLYYLSLHDEDRLWAQDQCLTHALHGVEYVQQMAIKGIGNLGRSCELNNERFISTLLIKIDQAQGCVRYSAIDAIGDILIYSVPNDYDRMSTLAQARNGTIPQMMLAVYAISRLEPDVLLAERICIDAFTSPHFGIRDVAIDGISKLIQRGTASERLTSILRTALIDPHWWVRNTAENAVEYLEIIKK